MSFEEKFPSLKWTDIPLYSDEVKSKILEHCLDKKKVKEAIENEKIKYSEYSDENAWSILEDIKKELGL